METISLREVVFYVPELPSRRSEMLSVCSRQYSSGNNDPPDRLGNPQTLRFGLRFRQNGRVASDRFPPHTLTAFIYPINLCGPCSGLLNL
jgi:hypothetical protein